MNKLFEQKPSKDDNNISKNIDIIDLTKNKETKNKLEKLPEKSIKENSDEKNDIGKLTNLGVMKSIKN